MNRYQILQDELRRNPRVWVVTGAAGFIGSHLVETLLRLGQQVVGLDNLSTGFRRNIEEVVASVPHARGAFRLIEGDVRSAEACMEACAGVDYVLHQAAIASVPRSMEDPAETMRVNVEGMLNMVLAARAHGVRRVVYASSSAVYGSSTALPAREEVVGAALSPYALSKWMDEEVAALYAGMHGVETVGLRYFNVFGPRQDPGSAYAAVIPNWTAALLAGERCTVNGDGETTRDFVHVGDVVQANLLAAAAGALPSPARVYNVGAGRLTSLNQLWETLAAAAHTLQPEEAILPPVHGPSREGDVRHSQADVARISAELGYEPLPDLGGALHDTVAWYARSSPLALTA